MVSKWVVPRPWATPKPEPVLEIDIKREQIAQRRLVSEARRDVAAAERGVDVASRSGNAEDISFARQDLELANRTLQDALAGARLIEASGEARRQATQLTRQNEAEDFLAGSSRRSLQRLDKARRQSPQGILSQSSSVERFRGSDNRFAKKLEMTFEMGGNHLRSSFTSFSDSVQIFGQFVSSFYDGINVIRLPGFEPLSEDAPTPTPATITGLAGDSAGRALSTSPSFPTTFAGQFDNLQGTLQTLPKPIQDAINMDSAEPTVMIDPAKTEQMIQQKTQQSSQMNSNLAGIKMAVENLIGIEQRLSAQIITLASEPNVIINNNGNSRLSRNSSDGDILRNENL